MTRALLLSLLLAACATTPPDVVEVPTPIPVPCRIATPARPDFAVDALDLGVSIWDQMRALRAERLQRKAYERELEAAVESCQ